VNKTGTCLLALAADRFGVPLYVAAETTKVDPRTIEGHPPILGERSPEELIRGWTLPRGVTVWNRFFELTPGELVEAYITEAGQVTDDSGQMLRMAQAIIESNGSLTVDGVVKQLLQWAEDPEVFRRFAGPTTRAAIEELRKGTDPRVVGRQGRLTSLGTSNGA